MSETLRDLVVSLSLQTDNFTRNIKSVNKQIQEAESKFRLAAAGIEAATLEARELVCYAADKSREQLYRERVFPREKDL